MDFFGNHHLRLLQKFRTGRVLFGFRSGLLPVASPDQSTGALPTSHRARFTMRISLRGAAKRSTHPDSDDWSYFAGGLLGRTFVAAHYFNRGIGLIGFVLCCVHLRSDSSAVHSGWPAGRLVPGTCRRWHLRLHGQYCS